MSTPDLGVPGLPPGLVSIIIPSYESARWLPEAVESCINQDYRPIEIIIVDDGSTDDTAVVMANLAAQYPDHVRCMSQSNQGAPAARNRGLAQARGEYVMFLDADDYLLDGALSNLVTGIGDASISYGDAVLVDAERSILGPKDQQPTEDDPILAIMLNSPCTGSLLLRRELFHAAEWDTSLPCKQDYELHVRFAISGAVFNHRPSNIAAIRQHRSPTRITVQTHTSITAAQTAASLYAAFRAQLLQQKTLTQTRDAFLNYSQLMVAIMLRRFGLSREAKLLYRKLSLKAVRSHDQFRWSSYAGIACLFGLPASNLAYRLVRAFRVTSARQ